MTKFWGTSGDDDYSMFGTAGDDIFNMWQGGNDTVGGDAGKDDFRFHGTFNSSDFVDGGAQADRLILNGDYSAGLTLSSTFVVDVERLRLLGAHDYNITINDDLLATDERLTVNAPLDSAHTLTFDGSAETDGNFVVYAGAGNDSIKGGDGDDRLWLGKGGDDVALGGDGDDQIHMGASLTADEQIDAGNGFNDRVYVSGDYSGANAVVFTDTTMVAVEILKLAGGNSYDFTMADGTVDSFTNLTLTVNAKDLSSSETARIDGSAEADSNYTMWGGHGNDEFIGGAFADTLVGNDGDDTLQGGGGLDDLTGGDGADTFVYTAGSESTGAFVHDFIEDFDASEDFFDTTASVGTVATASHAVSFATFDTDIANTVGDGLTGAYIITANGGDQVGHKYLVINNDADFHYNAGTDYVIDITFYTGTITTGNFI